MIKISANNLFSELGACATFGVDPTDYFTREREMRKAMTSWFIARRCLDAMRDYDTRPKPKKGSNK